MQGYQLTFFTEQDRRHDHQSIGEWLLEFARAHGAAGGTLLAGSEGIDHAGHVHSAHFFDLADQPLIVIVTLEQAACEKLMQALAQEEIDLAYVRTPIEFGRIGRSTAG